MDRLTEKVDVKGKGWGKTCYTIPCFHDCEKSSGCYGCENIGNVVDRLGEYEDTGLTPESVEALKVSMMGKTVSEIMEFEGLPIDRLKVLAEADKEGRVVVLPCKVGDTVYRVFNPKGREPVILEHALVSCNDIVLWLDKFGKTVFLTREEAEKALRRE